MSTFEVISIVSLFCLSAGAFTIGYRQYKEKGFLLNNAYIYASKKERDEMNKKPFYRQSSRIFTMFGSMFSFMTIEVIYKNKLVLCIVLLHVPVIIIYAIASSINISRNERSHRN